MVCVATEPRGGRLWEVLRGARASSHRAGMVDDGGMKNGKRCIMACSLA